MQQNQAYIDQRNVIAREDFTPFGSVMAGSEQANNTNSFGNRFTGHERDEQKYLSPLSNQGLDYMLARNYDPVLGRFLSVDPLADKYPGISPYAYVANNPIMFIDPDGREIVVPNKDDRVAVLKMINSRARGTFAFDDNGKLYVVKKEGGDRFSAYYRDKLIEGIESDKTISVNIAEKFTFNGTEYDTDKDSGGGATAGGKGTDQTIWISGNENTNLKDKEGNALRDEASDILAHELVGHAIPKVAGSDTGNAVENENKVRKEYKEKEQKGDSPLRAAEPKHKE